MDVSQPATVTSASLQVRKLAEGEMLYALVNNAGILDGSAAAVVDVNLRGVYTVCEAFASLLAPGSRVLNVSSGSAPMFVAKCSPSRRAFFANSGVSQAELTQIVARFTAAVDTADMLRGGGDSGASLQALGFPTPSEAKAGGGLAYGFSKAALNSYTLLCAAGRGPFVPGVIVNSLSPGFIATDLTRAAAAASGRTPEEMGAAPVREGTVALWKLMWDTSGATGRYYGSDGLRSPLDRYRSPGTPEWNGVDS
jgi:NAD(P)-dependent dehydrogenase (short-subunit alcohol dehydrogenase family)